MLPKKGNTPKNIKAITLKAMAVILVAAIILGLNIKVIKSANKIKSADVISVGQHLTFGRYEQDGDEANGAEIIQWSVLDLKDGKALLISDKLLDCKPYNDEQNEVTWETCTLRKWLNGDFINTAFSESEQKKIVLSNIHNPYNPSYSTQGCANADDRVFVLSVDEVKKYFSSSDDSKTSITHFVALKQHKLRYYTYDNWWLRTPGSSNSAASTMSNDGNSLSGYNVDCEYIGVRPAMWIEI